MRSSLCQEIESLFFRLPRQPLDPPASFLIVSESQQTVNFRSYKLFFFFLNQSDISNIESEL